MSQEKQDNFKNPTGLTKWTKWFLYAQLVITAIAIISTIFEFKLITDVKNGVYTSQEMMETDWSASADRQGIVGGIQFLISIISWILTLKWIYRANYNARQLGATDMIFTPGWSIGWYFIPIANLWKPYEAMKEIWKASKNPNNWKKQSLPSILTWWWLLSIVSAVLNNIAFRLSLRAKELDEFLTVNIITLLSDITFIPMCLITLAIITKLYKMQMSHYRNESNNWDESD